MLVSRYGTLPSRNFLLCLMQGEAAALEALHTFAAALSLSIGELETFEPIPAGPLTAHSWLGLRSTGRMRNWLALFWSTSRPGAPIAVECAKPCTINTAFPLRRSPFLICFANMPTFETEAMSLGESGWVRGYLATGYSSRRENAAKLRTHVLGRDG